MDTDSILRFEGVQVHGKMLDDLLAQMEGMSVLHPKGQELHAWTNQCKTIKAESERIGKELAQTELKLGRRINCPSEAIEAVRAKKNVCKTISLTIEHTCRQDFDVDKVCC